jgi:hypothetical protein
MVARAAGSARLMRSAARHSSWATVTFQALANSTLPKQAGGDVFYIVEHGKFGCVDITVGDGVQDSSVVNFMTGAGLRTEQPPACPQVTGFGLPTSSSRFPAPSP